MKKIFTLLLFFTALPVAAQQMLVDNGTDNPQIINFDEFDKITFSGTTVNIRLTDGSMSSSEMSDINRIIFGDYTGVDNIDSERKELVTYISCDAIAINSEAGTDVKIFNLIGTQIISTRLEAYGGKISIANLPRGIYIVKAGTRTTKIVKR